MPRGAVFARRLSLQGFLWYACPAMKSPMKTPTFHIRAYVTKDGSEIRELIHPDKDPHAEMSLAEATILPGRKTALHVHERSQEIYYVIRGRAVMRLGSETMEIEAGDSILILPGTEHAVHNTGSVALKILCCCSPAYSHEDTRLLDEEQEP